MTGNFSERDRERIHERLLAEGRELFRQYGLGKTTIGNQTDGVGIAAVRSGTTLARSPVRTR